MHSPASNSPDIYPPLARAAVGKRLVVFDYDGTLASLEVDWSGLRRALVERARRWGFEGTFRPLWKEMTRLRDEVGEEAIADLFTIIAEYERAGMVHQVPRLEIIAYPRTLLTTKPTVADDTLQPALAVFSANLHRTIEDGLDALGIRPAFAYVVGADDVTNWKPHCEGLQRAMRFVGVGPESTLFVGDSLGDADAARDAGVAFLFVGDEER